MGPPSLTCSKAFILFTFKIRPAQELTTSESKRGRSKNNDGENECTSVFNKKKKEKEKKGKRVPSFPRLGFHEDRGDGDVVAKEYSLPRPLCFSSK